MAGGRGDAEGPAERGQPVRHALDAGAHRRGPPVESPAVIPDGEGEGPAVLADGDAGLLGLRVLRDVLQRFQHAEIHRGLDLLGVPAQPGCFNGDRQSRLLRLRLECCREPRVRQQRRVDPPGEIPEFLQRVLRLTLNLREHLICFCWGVPRHLAGQPERDLERDKLLLRAIVQVPLQSPATTRRWREARTPSISATLRSTRPACAATSRTSRSPAGDSGSRAELVIRSAPSRSPWCSTTKARVRRSSLPSATGPFAAGPVAPAPAGRTGMPGPGAAGSGAAGSGAAVAGTDPFGGHAASR